MRVHRFWSGCDWTDLLLLGGGIPVYLAICVTTNFEGLVRFILVEEHRENIDRVQELFSQLTGSASMVAMREAIQGGANYALSSAVARSLAIQSKLPVSKL